MVVVMESKEWMEGNGGNRASGPVFCCAQSGYTEGGDGGAQHDTNELSGSLTMDG
jgi:hypothetical protein